MLKKNDIVTVLVMVGSMGLHEKLLRSLKGLNVKSHKVTNREAVAVIPARSGGI